MFEKGHEKIGGRNKGVKNKKTLLSADELLLQRDINPIEKLIDIAESDGTAVEQQIRCWQEIIKYTYPKLKSKEVYVEEDQLPKSLEIHFVNADGTREKL